MTDIVESPLIPSNPADQEKIFKAIQEAENSLIRIAAEKDQIKAIIETLHEDYKLDKTLARRMINTYYKRNIDEVEKKNEDFAIAYATIVKNG